MQSMGTGTPYERTLAVGVILAPLLLLGATISYAVDGGFNASDVGGTVQIFAMASWFLVVTALCRRIAPSMPRAAAALSVIGAIGVAGGVAYGLDTLHVAEAGTTAEDFGVGPIALQLPGGLFPLVNLGFGIALVRLGSETRVSGILLAVAAVLFPVSRIPAIEALAAVSDLLFVAALVPLGLRMLSSGRVGATEPMTA